MTKQIQDVLGWIRIIMAAIIAALSPIVLNAIKNSFSSSVVPLVLLVLAAVILFKFIELVANKILSASINLRKIIVGSDFIEGWWIDAVSDDTPGSQIESFGILQIKYADGQYQAFGTNYDLNRQEQGNFHCYSSLYFNSILRYSYDGSHIRQKGTKVDGFGEYQFTQNSRYPMAFVGFINDSRHGTLMAVRGKRIYDKQLLKTIDNIRTRRKIILDFLNEMQQPDAS